MYVLSCSQQCPLAQQSLTSSLCCCLARSGAVQAGLIGFGLFMFASRVEGMVYGSDLPSGYTVSVQPGSGAPVARMGWQQLSRALHKYCASCSSLCPTAPRLLPAATDGVCWRWSRNSTWLPSCSKQHQRASLPTACAASCCAVQARNIAVTVRTIIVGLMYLATFIFSANALGLTGEAAALQSHRTRTSPSTHALHPAGPCFTQCVYASCLPATSWCCGPACCVRGSPVLCSHTCVCVGCTCRLGHPAAAVPGLLA